MKETLAISLFKARDSNPTNFKLLGLDSKTTLPQGKMYEV